MSFCPESLKNFSSKIEKFRFIPDEKIELRTKQYFPYNYINSYDSNEIAEDHIKVLKKLEQNQLPQNVDDWVDILYFDESEGESEKEKRIKKTKEEIDAANSVFYKFGCKSLGDYLKLYLEVDILLLCESLDLFRNNQIKYYFIDPFYSYTLPGYSWKAWGYRSKTKLEYFNNRDVADFFMERDVIRGGITTVCRNKSLEANNKYMGEMYNQDIPDNFIYYLDITNLYVVLF